jgi:hypothetical protein
MATATSSHPALVLADPPEAGWWVRTRSDEEATVDAELLAAPGVRPSELTGEQPANESWKPLG